MWVRYTIIYAPQAPPPAQPPTDRHSVHRGSGLGYTQGVSETNIGDEDVSEAS